MENLNYMNKSSTRGIFLSIILLFSMVLVVIPLNVYAEEINVKSFAFEETTIIEFTNNSNEEVNTFRIWLGSDFSFKSFKTEKGWTGEKTPQGVIIFTSSETIKSDESVKFGIKTDKAKVGINWKALDKKDNQISTGKVLPGELPKVIPNTEPEQTIEYTDDGISTESTFKIIPEKPNVGSSIRVTGDKFGASQEFDFYINSKKIGSFETDASGHFMTTMKIPEEQKADRVNFIIKDKEGGEKKISLRLEDRDNNRISDEKIPLTITKLQKVIHPGELIKTTGTAMPGSTITATIYDPEGEFLSSIPISVDNQGDWVHESTVPLTSNLGNYRVEISDGVETESRVITVETSNIIHIVPLKITFEQGATMIFNATGIPNQDLEIFLENEQGVEIFAGLYHMDDLGFTEFEIPTTFDDAEGTYTLNAYQGKENTVIFVGLGVNPSPQIVAKMDKVNYKSNDIANISIDGPPTEKVSLQIISSSDKIVYTNSTRIGPDGVGNHSFNLEGYGSGIYTTFVKTALTQTDTRFSVGLVTGSGDIQISLVKEGYKQFESVLVLGKTVHANVSVKLTLIDDKGNEIKSKDVFADKIQSVGKDETWEGRISDNSLRIPADANPGKWKIRANSGSNLSEVEFDVLLDDETMGIVMSIGELEKDHLGRELFYIKITGVKQSVMIEIYSDSNNLVTKLGPLPGGAGLIYTPWIIPDNFIPGTYSITAKDAFNSVTANFVYSGM